MLPFAHDIGAFSPRHAAADAAADYYMPDIDIILPPLLITAAGRHSARDAMV